MVVPLVLQEEIKSASIGPKIQDSITNGAEYKSHDESHPTIGKNRTWKEIRRTRTTTTKHKRYTHTDQRVTDTLERVNSQTQLCQLRCI